MPKTSDFEFRQQVSLSSRASAEIDVLKYLSGSDPEISDSIGILWYLRERKMIDAGTADFIMGLLDVLRLSRFATSEKTNEISKLGFMLPAKEGRVVDE